MLAAGALVGIAAGLIAQLFLDSIDAEIRGLVRVALLLPGITFTTWWLLIPRQALEQEEREEEAEDPRVVDVKARLAKIESAFDDAAVPAARRGSLEQVNDAARETLLHTMRLQHGGERVDSDAYHLRRDRRTS
jgi:hypothetical protein